MRIFLCFALLLSGAYFWRYTQNASEQSDLVASAKSSPALTQSPPVDNIASFKNSSAPFEIVPLSSLETLSTEELDKPELDIASNLPSGFVKRTLNFLFIKKSNDAYFKFDGTFDLVGLSPLKDFVVLSRYEQDVSHPGKEHLIVHLSTGKSLNKLAMPSWSADGRLFATYTPEAPAGTGNSRISVEIYLTTPEPVVFKEIFRSDLKTEANGFNWVEGTTFQYDVDVSREVGSETITLDDGSESQFPRPIYLVDNHARKVSCSIEQENCVAEDQPTIDSNKTRCLMDNPYISYGSPCSPELAAKYQGK